MTTEPDPAVAALSVPELPQIVPPPFGSERPELPAADIGPTAGGSDQTRTLLEELVEDNVAVLERLGRLEAVQQDVEHRIAALRDDLGGALVYHALKDLCTELVGPLAAIDGMLERADFTDPDVTVGHLRSLAVTLRAVLTRMGAERVPVVVGEELYDSRLHRCARVLSPAESPFADAAPHTVVRVLADGYRLGRRPLVPTTVEIQSSRPAAPPDSAGADIAAHDTEATE